ncbi:MAG: DUF3034 family protein [Wenzhouxiangellaceae bacterium]
MFEGTAGGGLVPWAVLNGYATDEEISASGFYTHADVDDYELDVYGASLNFHNRLEVSFARQEMDLTRLGPILGLPGANLDQTVLGLKYRVYGDVLYTDWPQISLGLQYKKNHDFAIPAAVGASDDDGLDVYLSASKVFLGAVGGFNLLVNGTVRYSEANQTGLLGFGGPGSSDGHLNVEAAAGILLSHHLIVGAEYRFKSGNLDGLPEDDWYDFFIGYFPNRHIALSAAYINLGEIAGLSGQDGVYLSLEVSF